MRQHASAYVSIRQHTSAYVSIRQHTQPQSAASRGRRSCPDAYVSIRIAYVYLDGVRIDVYAYVCYTYAGIRIPGWCPKSTYTRARESSEALDDKCCAAYVRIRPHTSAYVSIRQHTSAYVSIRQHTSAYVSIRPKSTYTRARESSEALNAAYVSIRQHTSAYVRIRQHAYSIRERT
jgi:hypothetical protein